MAYKARVQFFDRENKDYITLADAAETDNKVDKDIFSPSWPWIVMSVELDITTGELVITRVNITTNDTDPEHTKVDRLAIGVPDEPVWYYGGPETLPDVGLTITVNLSDLSTSSKGVLLTEGNLVYKGNSLAFVTGIDDTAGTVDVEGIIAVKIEEVHHDITLKGTGISNDPDQLLGVRITVEGCSINPSTGDIDLGLTTDYPWSSLEQIMNLAVIGVQQRFRVLAGNGTTQPRPTQPSGIYFTLAGTREGAVHFSNDPTSPVCSWQEWSYNGGSVDVYIPLLDINGNPIPAASSGVRVGTFGRPGGGGVYGDVSYLSAVPINIVGCQKQDMPSIKDLQDSIDSHTSDVLPGNTTPHVSNADRANWNGKANQSDLTAEVTRAQDAEGDIQKALDEHKNNNAVHVSSADRLNWNGKANQSDFAAHIADVQGGNTQPHVSITDRANWNAKANQSDLTAEISRAQTAEGNLQTNINNEATLRTQGDANLQSQINGLQSLGRYLGAVDTAADMASFTLPSSATPNDFITVRADENHAGAVTRYVLVNIGPPPVWNYDFTLNDDTTGKMDKDVGAQIGNVAVFNSAGNAIDSGHALAEYVPYSKYTPDMDGVTQAIGQIIQSITDEEFRARQAEALLNSAIADEQIRAQGAESTIASNLAAEIARAQAAEGVITGNLANEITRATTAEAAEASARSAKDVDLQNQINAIKKNGNYQGIYAIQADLPITSTDILVGDWCLVASNNNGVPAIVVCTGKNASNVLTWTTTLELAAAGQAAKQFLVIRDMQCAGSYSGTSAMPDISTLPIGSYLQIFFDDEDAVLTLIATAYSSSKNLEIWFTSNKEQRVYFCEIEHWFDTGSASEDSYHRGGAGHDRTMWIRNFGSGSGQTPVGTWVQTNDAYGILMSGQARGEITLGFPAEGTTYYILIADMCAYPSATARIMPMIEIRRSKAPVLMTDQYTKEMHVS